MGNDPSLKSLTDGEAEYLLGRKLAQWSANGQVFAIALFAGQMRGSGEFSKRLGAQLAHLSGLAMSKYDADPNDQQAFKDATLLAAAAVLVISHITKDDPAKPDPIELGRIIERLGPKYARYLGAGLATKSVATAKLIPVLIDIDSGLADAGSLNRAFLGINGGADWYEAGAALVAMLAKIREEPWTEARAAFAAGAFPYARGDAWVQAARSMPGALAYGAPAAQRAAAQRLATLLAQPNAAYRIGSLSPPGRKKVLDALADPNFPTAPREAIARLMMMLRNL
jgi:hypothetical protein